MDEDRPTARREAPGKHARLPRSRQRKAGTARAARGPGPRAAADASHSQDSVLEDGHDGSADEARDRHSDEPGHEDVAEEVPVHRLPGAQPAHGDHRAHLPRSRPRLSAVLAMGLPQTLSPQPPVRTQSPRSHPHVASPAGGSGASPSPPPAPSSQRLTALFWGLSSSPSPISNRIQRRPGSSLPCSGWC